MIKQAYTIKAPVSDVWQALVYPAIIEKWSGDKAVMSAEEGADFDLWSGQIWGTNTKVVPETLIEQDWYGNKKWDKPSKVVIKLSEKDGATTVELIHSDIPKAEEPDFDAGWKDYYFGPMKDLLES